MKAAGEGQALELAASEPKPWLRKSAQEVEIDHLLAEEFSCDPAFAMSFVSSCGLPCRGFQVSEAIAEPSLGGSGFGDLLVLGSADGLKVALLIEDKISAAPAVRQAERYAAHANTLRGNGWERVWTILVAPASYRGERAGFDASIDLEEVVTLITSLDPKRQDFRRAIIKRALDKTKSSGVQVPDAALRELKADYFLYAIGWCAKEGIVLEFPALRDSYYDGDSWIDHIRHAAFPSFVWLRHRLWTSVKASRGRVDLIFSTLGPFDRAKLESSAPEGSFVEPYSKGNGLQISFAVTEMRQSTGCNHVTLCRALSSMKLLIDWYMQFGASCRGRLG